MERFSPFQQITIKEQPQPYAFPGEWFEIALCPLGEGGAVSPKEMLDSDDITLQTSLHLHCGRTPLKETRVASQHELVSLIFACFLVFFHQMCIFFNSPI